MKKEHKALLITALVAKIFILMIIFEPFAKLMVMILLVMFFALVVFFFYLVILDILS